MKKVLFILTIAFIFLTFCGAGYVLYNGGRVNAGYATIPCGFMVTSLLAYRSYKNGDDERIKDTDG